MMETIRQQFEGFLREEILCMIIEASERIAGDINRIHLSALASHARYRQLAENGGDMVCRRVALVPLNNDR